MTSKAVVRRRNYGESVDDARFGPIDFDWFHLHQLPVLLADRARIFSDTDLFVLRPIGFELTDGRAYTYVPEDAGSFTIESGVENASTVVVLPPDAWCSFAWDLRSVFSLIYGGDATVGRGSFGQLVRWEPPLRAAFDGQELYDIDDSPPAEDALGEPLDLQASFTLDTAPDAIGDFLHHAGFVHLRGVFDPEEIEAIRADVTAAVATARPDDRRSWWTKVGDREICNRVNYLNEQSARIAALGHDERLTRIAALGDPDLRDASDRLDGHSVVIKVPGATEGLADLPWHRDCGMGGHPVKCPLLNVGIQLDAATAATGRLSMIAGSHRGISRLPSAIEAERLPVATVDTEPGDVTAHFGHILHAAFPPTSPAGPGRRALYLTFVPPLTFEMVEPGHGYNDVLFARRDGRVPHVDELR